MQKEMGGMCSAHIQTGASTTNVELAPAHVGQPGRHAERAQPVAENVGHEHGTMLTSTTKEEEPHSDVRPTCRSWG